MKLKEQVTKIYCLELSERESFLLWQLLETRTDYYQMSDEMYQFSEALKKALLDA